MNASDVLPSSLTKKKASGPQRTHGIDCVVVNYRTPWDLKDFLDAYEECGPMAPDTLWIVNVQPEEESVRLAEKHLSNHQSSAVHISVPENIGYARACNMAAHMSQREVVAFFNADTMLDYGVADRCYKALMANDDWAVVGPLQVDKQDRIVHGGIFGTLDAPKWRVWMQRDTGLFNDVRDDAVTVMGSAYFVKRKIWNELYDCELFRDVAPDAVGAFLPTQHFYEETWFSYHAQAHGYKVVYFGEAKMVHKWHGASPMSGEDQAEKHMGPSRKYFHEACDHHGIARQPDK